VRGSSFRFPTNLCVALSWVNLLLVDQAWTSNGSLSYSVFPPRFSSSTALELVQLLAFQLYRPTQPSLSFAIPSASFQESHLQSLTIKTSPSFKSEFPSAKLLTPKSLKRAQSSVLGLSH
jgi:hypothetical protein